MIGKHLGERAWFLLVLGFQLLEHRGHRIRIVARRPHVLHPKPIRFFLCCTAEFQKGHTFEKSTTVIEDIANDAAAKQNSRQHAIVYNLHLPFIFHRMTRRDVPSLVRHDAGQLGFVIGSENQSLVHIEETTWQRKSIYFVRVDNFDCEWNLRV